MTVHPFSGRWSELEHLAAELLEGNEQRPSAADIHYRLCFLHALRGRTDAALTSLSAMAEWEHSTTPRSLRFTARP